MTRVVCKYYVQNDEETEPNDLFVISKTFNSEKEVTVREIYNAFPFKDTSYHLRFQTTINSTTKIWADIPNMDAPIPFSKGIVIIKALRLPDHIISSKSPSPQPVHHQAKYTPNEIAKPLHDMLIIDDPISQNPIDQENAAPQSKGYQPQHTDLKNDGFVPYEPPKNVYKSYEDNVTEKIDHLHKVWNKEENNETLRNEAYKKYEEKLKQWVGFPHKNNIRMLLSSLHNVIWEDSGWAAVSLSDLLKVSSVKINYFKAIRIVHPDKSEKFEDADKRYIANRIFTSLSESFKEFKVDEKES